MDLARIIAHIYPIPEASQAALNALVTEVHYPKGHILMRADRIEPDLYFIKKGIVRAYADTEDREVTFWFGKSGDTVLSLKSYVANEKGYENIGLLADTQLYHLRTQNLKELFATDIHIANLGRRIAEQELVKTEERLIAMQFKTASERYEDLLKNNPELVQEIQLGHIASYLGITQVSLSRIRAGLR